MGVWRGLALDQLGDDCHWRSWKWQPVDCNQWWLSRQPRQHHRRVGHEQPRYCRWHKLFLAKPGNLHPWNISERVLQWIGDQRGGQGMEFQFLHHRFLFANEFCFGDRSWHAMD